MGQNQKFPKKEDLGLEETEACQKDWAEKSEVQWVSFRLTVEDWRLKVRLFPEVNLYKPLILKSVRKPGPLLSIKMV
jgi:hypothetical protein